MDYEKLFYTQAIFPAPAITLPGIAHISMQTTSSSDYVKENGSYTDQTYIAYE